MKCLVILKGLAKTEKLNWVKREDLENYFLDIDDFKKLYSVPELIKPEKEALGRSFGNLIHQRFFEALLIRLGKGCLVVVDMNEESSKNLELLAKVHGYEVFYYVQPVPQDYCLNPGKYDLDWQYPKKQEELKQEVNSFLSLPLGDKKTISSYSDLLTWWEDNETIIKINPKDDIVHFSDIHSNYDLWKKEIRKVKKVRCIVHHGDYIDGPEVGGSRKMIEEIISDNSKNIIWLEGNHEIRLRRYLGWLMIRDKGSKTISNLLYSLLPDDFKSTTLSEFSDLTPKDAAKMLGELNKKLKTHAVILRGDNVYICTHAGLRFLEQLSPRHIGNVIYGGRDIERQDKEFSGRYYIKDTNTISVHAHCKYHKEWKIEMYPGVINIDPVDEYEIVVLYNRKNDLKYGKSCNKNKSRRCSKCVGNAQAE